MKINNNLHPSDIRDKVNLVWELSGQKILSIKEDYDDSRGSPVFTVNGKYTTRGWTEWTQGFQYGSAILQFDATGQAEFLEYARKNTINKMASHLTHLGVHDHGFNNYSTYGNLRRLMLEGRIPCKTDEKNFYELAIKVSAAVQTARWTPVQDGGYIYSFNGPHSLFVDTLRTCRILALGHQLGHTLLVDSDREISLLERLIVHALTTAKYSVFYGKGRDIYDRYGRVAHECIFNINDGQFRCVNTQQGYSPFTTWTRGLAWAMLGFAELLEFIDKLPESEFVSRHPKNEVQNTFGEAAEAVCDFYVKNTPVDGIPYWDTGAPGLAGLGDYLNKASDPFNELEPVDSSAAVIAAQGLLRYGHFLSEKGKKDKGQIYFSAGLTIAGHLFDEPYLSTHPEHQGLLLHSIYHRPNGWDFIPEDYKIPCNESSMWGDYHARELALYLWRIIQGEPYYKFFINPEHHG